MIKIRRKLPLLSAVLLCCGINVNSAQAEKIKKEDLIGTWIYVTTYTEFADGRKVQQFTDKPNGIFIIGADGRYSHHIMVPNRPNYASGNMWEGTPEENKATAQGTLSHFGTYTVDEETGSFTVSIEGSSFPNFEGMKQTRLVTKLTPEQLKYVNLAPVASGGKVFAELRRAKRLDGQNGQ